MKPYYLLSILFLLIACKENGVGSFEPIDEPDPTTVEITPQSKKGVAFTNRAKDWSHKTSNLKAHWMYSWGNSISEAIPEGVEFVPMFWGKGSVNDDNINRIKALADEGKVKYILGFNEPDGESQANMSVDEAIELWPRLEEIGVPIGSPATVHPDNDWMLEFMQRADAEGLRVDFIAVHSYGGPTPQNFINLLNKTYRLYDNRPIWITEFAVADWSATSAANNRHSVAEVEAFMAEVLPALDEIDWVHRYAWFSGTNPPLVTSSLFTDESEITSVGQMYADHNPNEDIGPGVDTSFEPEVDPNELMQNPGFETGSISPWGGFKNATVFASDTFTPFEGNYSGRINNGDGSLFQIVSVDAGSTYSLSYHTSWQETVNQNIFATIRNNADNNKIYDLPEVPFTTDWVESTYEFVVPDTVSKIKVQFYKPNGFPPLFLDDFSLKLKE